MIKKVYEIVHKYQLLSPHDRVVVAVSGGPDSVALLNILLALSERFRTTLIMAYLNHNMRGEESIKEEEFVRRLSKSLGLPLIYRTVDILAAHRERGRGMSIEELGRQERYNFFFETAQIHRAQKIAVGHHFNDQIETVMINIIRGSGIEGLKGFLPIRDANGVKVIRPLIECTKDEILQYLEREGLSFVSDTTNKENIYLRNKIRNHLIPEIKNMYNQSFEKNLYHMSDIMRIENDFLSMATKRALVNMKLNQPANEYIINIQELLSYHEAIQNRVIKSILLAFSPMKKGISYIHIKSLKDLIIGNNLRASLNLPFGIEAMRKSEILTIRYRLCTTVNSSSNSQNNEISEFVYDDIRIPGIMNIRECNTSIRFDIVDNIHCDIKGIKNSNIAYMDYDKLKHPMIIRNVRTGDRIMPLGMRGTQKLKSFFIDKKIPIDVRYKIPLLVDNQSVIWIAGMRLSERVKITDETRKIIKVEIV